MYLRRITEHTRCCFLHNCFRGPQQNELHGFISCLGPMERSLVLPLSIVFLFEQEKIPLFCSSKSYYQVACQQLQLREIHRDFILWRSWIDERILEQVRNEAWEQHYGNIHYWSCGCCTSPSEDSQSS